VGETNGPRQALGVALIPVFIGLVRSGPRLRR
jgi:hypothetical protein